MAILKPLLLSLFGITNTLLSVAAQNNIFHGTSVVIYPNATSIYPGDSSFVAANFYCYFTPVGYLSFGWWLDAVPGSDTDHCSPRPSDFDWFEYTTGFDCSETGCRTHAINFHTSNPKRPYFEEDYVISALDLGNGKMGELGLSYFDKAGGGYAVGTRRTLNDRDASPQVMSDCQDALQTFQDVKKKYKLDLPFDLENVCPTSNKGRLQKILGL